MELVEEHGGDARQRGIVEDHAREDALGHHLHPGARGHFRPEADPEAHPAAHLLAQRLRHAVGDGAGGDAPRLQHEDLARPGPGLLHQDQRHPRRLAGPRRRHDHGARAGREGARQGGKDGIDGQDREGHARRLRFLHPVRKRDSPDWHETRVRALPLRCTGQGPPDVPERDGGGPSGMWTHPGTRPTRVQSAAKKSGAAGRRGGLSPCPSWPPAWNGPRVAAAGRFSWAGWESGCGLPNRGRLRYGPPPGAGVVQW